MHMADALISPAVGGTMWAVSAAMEAYSINRLGKEDIVETGKIPMMGVAGAFVFAVQMINFSIPGTGSSGHLAGGLLLAALLGPHAGFLVMSVTLAIQALFFADGGLLALGCNIFNLGFFPCFIAYPLITGPILRGGGGKRVFAACVPGALCGLTLGSLGVVLETYTSGVTELPLAAFAAFMLPIHAAIGVVEGIVTALALVFLRRARPSLTETEKSTVGLKSALAALALCAALLAGFVSFYASQEPDGLEWSIQNAAGHASAATGPEIPGGGAEPGPAGLVGSAAVLITAAGLGFAVKRLRKPSGDVDAR